MSDNSRRGDNMIDIGPHSATWGDIGKGIILALVPVVVRGLVGWMGSLFAPSTPAAAPAPPAPTSAAGTP